MINLADITMGEVVRGTLSVGGALGGLKTFQWMFVNVRKAVKGIDWIIETLKDYGPRIQALEDDGKPNGGGSKRDQTNRIESDLKLLRIILKDLDRAARVTWRYRPKTDTYVVETVTDEFYDMTGISADEVSQGGWSAFVEDPHVREDMLEEARVCAALKHKMRCSYWGRHIKTGARVHVEHRGDPIVEWDGRASQWHLVLRPTVPQPIEIVAVAK